MSRHTEISEHVISQPERTTRAEKTYVMLFAQLKISGVKTFMEAVKSLECSALDDRLVNLRSREREVIVEMLRYLAELDERKLYADLGYNSLFSYLTDRLGYSESGAYRRVSSARLAAKYPLARHLLVTGALNLSTLSAASSVLTEENAETVLRTISGRSKREVEEIVCTMQAKPLPLRESVKAVAVKFKVKAATPAPSLFEIEKPSKSFCIRQEDPAEEAPVEKRFELRLSVNEQTMSRLREVQALLSNRFPKGVTLENTLEALAEEFLKRKSPVERVKRRAERTVRIERTRAKTRGRHIPDAVRDAVMERDGACCTYVSPEGKRCGCRRQLELDHVRPFALGGAHTVTNLRVLCRAHNQLAARRAFGSPASNCASGTDSTSFEARLDTSVARGLVRGLVPSTTTRSARATQCPLV